MYQVSLLLQVMLYDDVLILQLAKFKVYKGDSTTKLIYDSGVFELNYTCDKGTIYAKRKSANPAIYITPIAIRDMLVSPRMLYDYIKMISGFDCILPKTISCRSFY